VRARHPATPGLDAVLARSSFLIDGQQARTGSEGISLREGAVVEVLPPFAGG
jgi:molybdopterin converting factor small subunit